MFDSFLRSLLAFAVVLGTLIVFHEAGHFLVAKLLRFKVDVFSVGFGRRLWGFRRKETDYRLSLIPLGGYVRVVGLVDESVLTEGEQEGPPPPEQPPRRLAKIAIFCAGPLANALLAVVILGFAYMLGREVPAYLEQPVVAAWVVPDSPAAKAGILPGDRVIAIENKPIESWDEYQLEVLTSGGRTRNFRVRRSADVEPRDVPITIEKVGAMDAGRTGIVPFVPVRVVDVLPGSSAEAGGMKKGDVILSIEAEPLTPFRDVSSIVSARAEKPTRFQIRRGEIPMELVLTPKASGTKAMIGIQLRFEEMVMRRLGFFSAFRESVRVNADMTVKTLEIIGKLFRREAPLKQMSGPLEIAKFAGQESKQGLASFLAFMAMVSLQLFIFNALPIPLLDGFHIVLVAVEGIIRRDFPLQVKERIFQVGFALLVALMLFVLYFDVVKSAAGIKKIFGG